MIQRTHESAARRASRAAFAAAAAVALYTAAAFGALLYAGLVAPLSCLLAAACGVGVALIAAKVVLRHEVNERERRFAQAQLESARDRAKETASPVAPPSAAPLEAARRRAPVAAPAAAAEGQERREIRMSREIQSALLPHEVPFIEGYHVEVDYQPCGALGGDFYDFRRFADGRLLMTLGDVSGKGPAGAIVMAMVQTLFRENADELAGPAELLRRVNQGFAGALGKGIFVTSLVGVLDPAHHQLTLAGAGHHPVLLLNPSARRTTQVGARGLALGLVAGRGFGDSLVETTIDLAPGDSLLLYTDGATESVADLAADVGENRLRAAAAAAILPGPHGALQRLRDDLWADGGRRDDTTLMLVTRLGEQARDRLASDRTAQDATA